MKRLTLRLDEKNYENVKFLADTNKRSVNAEIEFIIESYIISHMGSYPRYDVKITPK